MKGVKDDLCLSLVSDDFQHVPVFLGQRKKDLESRAAYFYFASIGSNLIATNQTRNRKSAKWVSVVAERETPMNVFPDVPLCSWLRLSGYNWTFL